MTNSGEMKTGIQLYTVREDLKADFRGTLEKLAALGFQGVELAFFYGGLEPKELASLLSGLGLDVCGIYEHFGNLCDPSNMVYEYARALDCRYLTSGMGLDDLKKKFPACVQMAKKACALAASRGLTVCYHAHSHEFQKTDQGQAIMDELLDAVPEMMFEADTAWIKLGGEDVIGYMRKHAARIPLIHVKDVTADGKVTELGNGVIDFKAVADFARANGIAWLNYEQDSTTLTPLESAGISIRHLKSLLR